jgi:hypothetical protein
MDADGPVPAVYLLLQVRTLNNDLRATFSRWSPEMKVAA